MMISLSLIQWVPNMSSPRSTNRSTAEILKNLVEPLKHTVSCLFYTTPCPGYRCYSSLNCKTETNSVHFSVLLSKQPQLLWTTFVGDPSSISRDLEWASYVEKPYREYPGCWKTPTLHMLWLSREYPVLPSLQRGFKIWCSLFIKSAVGILLITPSEERSAKGKNMTKFICTYPQLNPIHIRLKISRIWITEYFNKSDRIFLILTNDLTRGIRCLFYTQSNRLSPSLKPIFIILTPVSSKIRNAQ